MKGDGNKLITHYAFRITVLALFLMYGCGYRVHGRQSLPFQEVRIGPVDNKTYEPKLQDRLHRALTAEFLRQGIRVSRSADRSLSCTVRRFDMVGLSEAGGIITEYRVVVDADCRLSSEGSGGPAATVSVTTPFIVSFGAADAFGALVAGRESAEDRAAADLAAEIVGGLIFR